LVASFLEESVHACDTCPTKTYMGEGCAWGTSTCKAIKKGGLYAGKRAFWCGTLAHCFPLVAGQDAACVC